MHMYFGLKTKFGFIIIPWYMVIIDFIFLLGCLTLSQLQQYGWHTVINWALSLCHALQLISTDE